MGTRADFYIGRGEKAEWLGSIAWDGDPENYPSIIKCKTDKSFRKAVAELLKTRDDATTTDKGWPWPWEDSRTTDYAIAFYRKKVFASCFGMAWYDPHKTPPKKSREGPKVAVFPKMKTETVALDKRSGLIFVG